MDSKSKNIVIIGPAYPLRGGLATYNQILASKLQEAGHHVKIITFKLQYPSIFFPGKTQYSTDPKPQDLHIEVSLNSINPFNWYRVGKKLKKEKVDLVIFRYWMPFMAPCLGTVGRLVRGNGHTKVVAITDNVIPHEKQPFDKQATSYFLNSCDGYVCMSRAVLQDLHKFNTGRPSKFNPHPMYESFGEELDQKEAVRVLELDPDFRYFLFFGFIREYKGLDLLLKAFASKQIDKTKVKLIIAGEYYEDEAKYKQLINELGIEDSLIQHNSFIPDSKVNLYFSAADLVVQTYKDATQSGVTQVAYYYGKPMLVTNVGGLAELVPDGKVGYVCEVDQYEITNALQDFLQENRYAEYRKEVEQEREKFRWEPMIQSLFEVARLGQ